MGLLKRIDTTTSGEAPVPPPSLADPDPAVRRRAVQALCDAPDAVETLAWLLRTEPDNSVRQAAFLALSALDTPEAAASLAGLLAEPDPALRNGALEALAAMPLHAAGLLEPLGRNADPDIRSFAVLIATDLPSEAAGAWLIAMAEREADPNVCAHLAEALGGSGLAGAAAAIAAIADRFPDDAFLRFATETALRRLGSA